MTGPNRFVDGTRVDSLQLRRHTVRIAHPDGRLLGSGFFAAPGWVLTAAHVVTTGDGALELVTVTPSDPAVGTAGVPATVEVRSGETSETPVWPFPDVAILQLRPEAEWVERHPCVWLAERDPSGACHAYGYPQREDGVDPPGGPALFKYEGRTGDGYLQLSSGQAVRGLSGAPLVCPAQRGVVGIMVSTRDEYRALGGLAAPVFDLNGEFPGVPAALSHAYQRVRELNRVAVLADRAEWHKVLPIDGAELALDRPWEPFRRLGKTLPAEMLLADSGVVPYLFRDEDLEAGRHWCEQPTPMEVWRFTGPGGAGKTRHAIELCKIMLDRGWLAGFLAGPDQAADVTDIPLPRLIVMDYVEAFAAKDIKLLLDRLRLRATELAPVRVLLLTRTAAGGADSDLLRQVGDIAGSALRNVLNDAPDPVVVGAMSRDQRARLYDQAFRHFHQAWHGRPPPPRPVPNLRAARYAVPLEVLLEAFDHALSDGVTSTNRPPVDRALGHEQRYWEPTPAGLAPAGCRAAVALATLAGADDDQTGDELLRVLPIFAGPDAAALRRETVAWLGRLYVGPLAINALRPDRLGEALVAATLSAQPDAGRALLLSVLRLRDDAQVSRSLDLLARLAAADPAGAAVVADALFDCHRELVERAETQAHGADGRPGRLDLAVGLQRLLASALSTRMEALAGVDTAALSGLSLSYNQIGDLARRSGRSDRAGQLYRMCLDIRRDLVRRHPADVHLARELSISYNKLGDLAHRTSQTPRALELYGLGRQLRERLVRENPGNLALQSDLAGSYGRLADVAAETGERSQADVLYRERHEICARLVLQEPGNPGYNRDLSLSYDKLGDLATEEHRSPQAKTHYEAGLAIRERLRDRAPQDAAIARDLSNSYARLGDLHADAGEWPEAWSRYQQALTIRRRLSEVEPDNTTFARDLFQSYERLGSVADSRGERGPARELYRQGLAIVERLAAAERHDTTFARDVSVILTDLGDVARDEGDWEDARALFSQGLDGAQRLLALEPENVTFARDVAAFYGRLGMLPGARGAETLLSAAVHFRRKLHEESPDRADLAEELALALFELAEVAEAPAKGRLFDEILALLGPFGPEARLTGTGQRLLEQARTRRGQGIS
jgi:tetratricopeptide (TPR) repeat protein